MTATTRKRFSLASATAPSAGEPVNLPAASRKSTPAKSKSPAQKESDSASKSSRRPDVQTSIVEQKIAFTWRMKIDEAEKLEDLLIGLRRSLGRPRLDRATVLQALVDLVVEKDNVRSWLTKRLDV